MSQWAEFTHEGDYRIVVTRLSDGRKLIDYSGKIDLWREGAGDIRPKYGIYRSIGKNHELLDILRDEQVKFADFELTELEK